MSDPLQAAINNGKTEESLTKTYPIKDVDVDVFIALCEFAYTRDYTSSIAKVSKLQSFKPTSDVVVDAEDENQRDNTEGNAEQRGSTDAYPVERPEVPNWPEPAMTEEPVMAEVPEEPMGWSFRPPPSPWTPKKTEKKKPSKHNNLSLWEAFIGLNLHSSDDNHPRATYTVSPATILFHAKV